MNNGNVSDPVGRAVCDLSPVPTVHHVQALYPFKGSNNDELCFRKGDIITVTQMEEGGWWEGTLRGRTGWFPSNYVKECEPGTEVGIGSSSTSSPSSSALLAPQQQFANRVKILETFIEAERAFLLEMDNFLLQMVPPLRNHKVNLDDLSSLFTDLERLVAAHRTLMTTVVTESRRQSCDANGNDAGSGFTAGPRIGKIFLQNAAELQAVHTVYSRAHPKAVGVIDKFRDEINAHLMKATSGAGGVIVLIKKLSGPFRRLSQFPPFLQEWKGQLEDSNPDRGDSQRAAQFFRDVVAECSAHRREAELELEVMNGNFTDWDSGQCPLPKQLGPILKMSRALIMWDGLRSKEKTAAHRFLLAFARQLVVLSTAPTMTSFVFQGNIPFTHVTSIEVLDDVEGRSFSLEGPNMDKLTATFEQKVECTDWVHLVEKQTGCTSAGAAVATHRRQSSLDLREADARAATETFRRGGSLRVGSCSKPTAMFPVTPQSVPKSSIVKQAEVEPKKSAMVMGVEPQLREEAPWREGMTQIFHAGENLIAEVVDAYCRLKCAAISQGPFSMGFEEESAVDAMQIVDSYPNMSSGSLEETVHGLVAQVHALQRDFNDLSQSHHQLLVSLRLSSNPEQWNNAPGTLIL